MSVGIGKINSSCCTLNVKMHLNMKGSTTHVPSKNIEKNKSDQSTLSWYYVLFCFLFQINQSTSMEHFKELSRKMWFHMHGFVCKCVYACEHV